MQPEPDQGIIQGLQKSESPCVMLTDVKIKNAKPKGRSYKLFDERGLFHLIGPTGSKLWRGVCQHTKLYAICIA